MVGCFSGAICISSFAFAVIIIFVVGELFDGCIRFLIPIMFCWEFCGCCCFCLFVVFFFDR